MRTISFAAPFVVRPKAIPRTSQPQVPFRPMRRLVAATNCTKYVVNLASRAMLIMLLLPYSALVSDNTSLSFRFCIVVHHV